MKMDDLQKCFNEASHQDKKYVAVQVEMQGFEKPEIIINENANFDEKAAYYANAYNDDLTLKTFNVIKIVGCAYGNSFSDIEFALFGNDKNL